MESIRRGLWLLTVWNDVAPGTSVPKFTPLAATTAYISDSLTDGTIAFHPTEPLLIVSGDIEIFVWAFNPDKQHKMNFVSLLFYPY